MAPPPVYASNLIGLLRDLGMTQKELAARLHVPTGSVSLWSTGKRPVPWWHMHRLIEIVRESIREHEAVHNEAIREALLRWEREMLMLLGQWGGVVRARIQVLADYQNIDVMALDREQRRHLRTIAMQIVQFLDYIDTPSSLAAMGLHEEDASLEALLESICRGFGIRED